MIWGYSAMLDLCLCWHPAWDWDVDDDTNLRFYNRRTERYLCDMTLVENRLAVAQASLHIAESQLAYERDTREQERAAAQAELERAQQAGAAAEARIRELEERLRRQQS